MIAGDDVPESWERCVRCQKPIRPGREVWLEANWKTGIWTNPAINRHPDDESQGCFAFGAACANAVLRNGGELPR